MKYAVCLKLKNHFYSLASTFLLLFFTVATSSFSYVYAQKTISVKYIDNNEFKIDGELDEAMWQQAEVSSDFQEFFPTDSKKAEYQTELRVLYNEKYLYVAIKCIAQGKDYLTPSYERDFDIGGFDFIDLMFDTYSDRTNAFLFGINPFGVVREGLISSGGIESKNLDLSWDVKWQAESKIFDGYYISEIRIPMSAFKFKENETR